MLLTCDKCHTQYNIDASKVGTAARKMRCAKCQHVWTFVPEGADTHPTPSTLPHVMPPAEEAMARVDRDHVIPASVRPYAHAPLPAVDVHVFGMGAGQFGLFSFLFLTFVTLIVLFLFRTPVTQAFPTVGGFYGILGLEVAVPGEGFQFSEIRATRKEGNKLEIRAKMSNISSHEMDYPPLHVELLGAYGAVLREWNLNPENAVLTSGGAVPINLSFNDVPEEGKTVEIQVAKH